MIIQCDHCSAKFRIDDAKLANGAVKVRCAKCKEVFVVEAEIPQVEAEAPPQTVAQSAEPSAPADFFGAGSDFSFDEEQPPASAAVESQSPAADEFDWKDTAVKLDTAESAAGFDDTSFEVDLSAPQASPAPAIAADADSDFDFGDINLQPSAVEAVPPSAVPVQEDFSIDFGEVSFAAPPSAAPESSQSFSESSATDFSFDTPETAAPSAVGGADGFLLSFDTDQVATSTPAAVPAETGGDVNFGDFNFGEMAEEQKSEQGLAHEPLYSPEAAFAQVPFAADADDDYVPTALSSRVKSGSRFPLFLILGAILLIVVLAGSGVYFFGGPKAFSRIGLGFLVDWYGEKSAEEGSIAIRNISSSYLVNSSAGELFVVKGEAVNNFKKPRASIQVKVAILGPGGAVLAGKTAYCGNSLSSEQLATLPLAKIEETMNNQFGDSLANLGVKPGSAIPFVIVMSAVPKESTDYSVQIAGSTVATQ